MKVMTFTSLDELNKFLEDEYGAPPIPLGREAAEGGVFTVKVSESEAEADELRGLDGAEGSAGYAPDDHRLEELQAKLESYIEMSTDQLALVIRQRDDAMKLAKQFEALFDGERESHLECHEHFGEHAHQIRVQGYAEGVANGLYPGKPFETLDQHIQEAIMRQAAASISHLDDIRSTLNAPIVH